MDLLPSEIVIHILHFLPGEDVAKLKQLNSRTKRIVKNNRHSISLPEIFVSTHLDPDENKIYLEISCETDERVEKNEGEQDYTAFVLLNDSETNGISMENDPFLMKFFGDYEFLSYYDFFRILLDKGDITLCLDYPFPQSTLTAFGDAIDYANGQITTIEVDLVGVADDTLTDFAACLLLIGEKVKKKPVLRISPNLYNIHHEWMPIIARLGQMFTDFALKTDRICTILELIVTGLLHRSDEAIDVCIEFTSPDSKSNPCNIRQDLFCGFRRTNRLLDVIPQLPQSFVENHRYHNIPDSISFEAIPDCKVTLTKKNGFVYIRKTLY